MRTTPDTRAQGANDAGGGAEAGKGRTSTATQRRHRRAWTISIWAGALAITFAAAFIWLGVKASTIKSELEATSRIVSQLKDNVVQGREADASAAIAELQSHTSAARDAASDPLWTMASAVPWLGSNFSATAEIARSADDVATLGVAPLIRVLDHLDWDGLLPGSNGANLAPIQEAAPSVASAAHVVRVSSERLNSIEASSLLPQVADPLVQVRSQLSSVQENLEVAASASRLAPAMLGSGERRRYLLLIQNNAEIRATGGIPGALAVLTADKGKLTLGSQTTAGGLGVFVPPIPVDSEQQGIYSARLGKFVQDINLTPDFPTVATTAEAMWEKKNEEKLDGVISIDPVALGYILDATGPVELADPQVRSVAAGMPAQLTGKNVVKTLLSDVYAKIAEPKNQDAYFAAVASDIFGALSSGKGEAKQLLEGIGRGVSEHRILLWSSRSEEQTLLKRYSIGGSVSGSGVSPAQFGVYLNDGTGAKMDYYVKRTVQLVQQCPVNGYNEVKVRITSTNTAPTDAGTSLPAYVTGGGVFGIPPGSVQTNVVAYGPFQAHIESATQDGAQIPFGAQRHDERPVGTVTTLLAPGQTMTVEFNFGHIVQHAEPELVVTPTTESVKNVVQDAQRESCNSVE